MKPLGILLIGAIILIVVVTAYTKIRLQSLSTNSNTPAPAVTQTPQAKSYLSKSMKLSINVPSQFTLEDQATRILVNSDEGSIIISRAGTQFTNLNSYLEDLDVKNSVKPIEQQDLEINGYKSKLRLVQYPGSQDKERVYKIFVEPQIYTLTTSSESLYSDLDQIAKSFRYTP